jgi:hypothetical protein
MNNIVNLFEAQSELPYLTSITGFTTKSEPIYREGGRQIFGNRTIVRTDTDEELGIVGNRYASVNNQDLYDMLVTACQDTLPKACLKGAELKEISSYRGAYTRFELAFPEMKMPIEQKGSETELKFRVGISNTFDGNGSVRVLSGAYDQVCENGMCIGEVTRAYARHTVGFTPAKFSEFIASQMVLYNDRCNDFQRWAKFDIDQSQFETILTENNLSERKTKNLVEQFQIESQTRGSTLWSALSAMTFYSTHDSSRFSVRNSSTVDNHGATSEQREREVNKILRSESWQRLALAA